MGELKQMEKLKKMDGGGFWMYRYLCYKYWVEFKTQPKGKKKKKSQWDKAIDCAKKMTKLAPEHPLGYALMARSNVTLIKSVDKMDERIESDVQKAEELADGLLSDKAILPQLYYETMVHCGIAMYQIGKDGASYYNKACDNAPHGETLLMKLQRESINTKLTEKQVPAIRKLLKDAVQKKLNIESYNKTLNVMQYDFKNIVSLANDWNLFTAHNKLSDTGVAAMNITKPNEQRSGQSVSANVDIPPPPPEKKKKKK